VNIPHIEAIRPPHDLGVIADQTITSGDLSIGQLFEDFYVLANYQREFVWSEQEVRRKRLNSVSIRWDLAVREHFGSLYINRNSENLCLRGPKSTTLTAIFSKYWPFY
jgi:hypothetical protein